MHTRRTLMFTLAASIAPAMAATRGNKALYLGGTVPALEPKTEGLLDVSGTQNVIFTWRQQKLEIPYAKVSSLEYGQKAGRRVGVALVVTPLALFSKKRKHYLTIGYEDAEGKRQGAVFELAKGTVRTILTTLTARTGKQIEYESEEAKRNVGS
jgi:hypothetical protein